MTFQIKTSEQYTFILLFKENCIPRWTLKENDCYITDTYTHLIATLLPSITIGLKFEDALTEAFLAQTICWLTFVSPDCAIITASALP